MDVVVRGKKVLGDRSETYKLCERCGTQLTVVRRKVRGMNLCGSCKHDHWWIDRVGT